VEEIQILPGHMSPSSLSTSLLSGNDLELL
jgi:hypothetical protein